MFDMSSGSECWFPSVPINVEYRERISIVKYGDGYEQRMLDGLNYMETIFNVSFDMRPASVIILMDEYLTAQIGGSFPWYHPVDGVEYIVVCDQWNISWGFKKWDVNGVRKDYGTLTASFKDSYGTRVAIEVV